MSDIFCHLRSTECGCQPHECKAARPASLAPVHSFTARHQLAAIACGLFVFGVVWIAMTKADEHYRKAALDCQESCVSWRK